MEEEKHTFRCVNLVPLPKIAVCQHSIAMFIDDKVESLKYLLCLFVNYAL